MKNPAETLAAIGAALDKLEALEKAATKGPWVIVHGDNGYPVGIDAPNDAGVVGAVGSVVRKNGLGFPSGLEGQANASLIAASRSFVPGALVYMRAEHKAVSEMVSGLEERDAAIPRFIHDWIARLAAALGIEVQP